MAIRFGNQRELLEHLNKNVNDRSLIQRMMKRWEVYKEDGGYYLVEREREEEKKSEIKEDAVVDDKELKELREMNEKLIVAYKDLRKRYDSLKERCKKEMERADVQWGLYDHLVFFYWKFRERKKFVEWKVFWEAEHKKNVEGTQDTMETVRPYMYERYKFTYWEVEDAECAAVEKIIAKRWEELSEIPF